MPVHVDPLGVGGGHFLFEVRSQSENIKKDVYNIVKFGI